MNKTWDKDKGGRTAWIAWMTEIAAECLRLLKPGGHALVWALPRTSHWTATAWEDAGFELRDKLFHLFGSGFPKSANVSKLIDKAAGAEREVIGVREDFAARAPKNNFDQFSAINPSDKGINSRAFAEKMGQITAPATDAARQWDGWGSALKPSVEEWLLLRKPLSEPTIAANVLLHGCGALNIDGCRIGTDEITQHGRKDKDDDTWGSFNSGLEAGRQWQGRWPANLVIECTCDSIDWCDCEE